MQPIIRFFNCVALACSLSVVMCSAHAQQQSLSSPVTSSVKGVELTNKVTLADTADRWVA